MATSFKTLDADKTTSVRTKLHEAIPITGSIVSGTYADSNVKTFSHGMFQSVYDYPYLSSSANHIFDITCGVASTSSLYSSITVASAQKQKKNNIYNQMAQLLVGYDETGSIRPFDRDGILADAINDTNKHLEGIYINFSRLLTKDEIQKESFSMEFMVSSGYATPASNTERIKVYDYNALNNYRINSPAGEYGILYATNSSGSPISGTALQVGGASAKAVGLIYYQAGIVVLNPEIFLSVTDGGILSSSALLDSSGNDVNDLLTGSSIGTLASSVRNRMYNIAFNNTTELNSTIYFCDVKHSEFNYSSNPTYLSGSKVYVKNDASDTPVSYFTTVGLYSADNELLAVAKLSEPLKKSPEQNYTIRVRLDY